MSITTIQFTVGGTIDVASVNLNDHGDTVFAGGGHSYDAYELYGIKSIIPPKDKKVPTLLQDAIIRHLQSNDNYVWDKQHSVAAAGVVLKRQSDGDFWFFGMEGEIMHNPEGITIKL